MTNRVAQSSDSAQSARWKVIMVCGGAERPHSGWRGTAVKPGVCHRRSARSARHARWRAGKSWRRRTAVLERGVLVELIEVRVDPARLALQKVLHGPGE